MPKIDVVKSRNESVPILKHLDIKGSSEARWILVMDDDEIMRVVMRAMLDQAGYRSYITENTEETLECYQEAMKCGYRFDAVILDLHFSGNMRGKETIDRLREIDPLVKAIAMSGNSDDPVILDCSSYGFSAALAKPFTSQDLVRTVQRVIDA